MTSLLLVLALLTPAQERGRHLYRTGESQAERPVTAIVQGTEMGASILACANCHGREGRGVPEGNVAPSDIRWSTLQKYAAPEIGRKRPKYNDETLARAIREGVDAAGNPLSPVMPHFRIGDEDLSDLIAYLKLLGNEAQPGLTDDRITIAGSSKVVENYFERINAEGGVYGRKLELKDVPPSEAFAVLGPATLQEDDRVPHVAPLPAASPASASFFLFGDLQSQVLALQKHAGAGAIHVMHDGSPAAVAAAEALGAVSPEKTNDDLLFLIGPGVNVSKVMQSLGEWTPRLLIAGATIEPDILDAPKAFHKRIVIAVPTLPSDLTETGYRELQSLGAFSDGAAMYAAAKVLVEGLKRAGRDVTQETLIAALEQLYEFPTEVTPPVTFSRDRRIGASEPHVVVVDLETRGFVTR